MTIMPRSLVAAALAFSFSLPPLVAEEEMDEFEEFVIPEGTEFKLMLHDKISSRTMREGDRTYASLIDPVYVYDDIVLPKGTFVEGRITDSHRARHRGRGGYIYLIFDTVELPTGQEVPITGSLAEIYWNEDGDFAEDVEVGLDGELKGRGASRLKQTAIVLGSVASGGAVGVGVGIAAGFGGLIGAIIIPRGHEAVLGEGSVVGMRLDRYAIVRLNPENL